MKVRQTRPSNGGAREQPYFSGMSFAHRQKFGKFDLVAGGHGFVQTVTWRRYDRFGREYPDQVQTERTIIIWSERRIADQSQRQFLLLGRQCHLFSPAETP